MKHMLGCLILLGMVASCSSCCKREVVEKKTEDTTVESYDDFELADENNETLRPEWEREYNIKMKVIHRTYLV